MKGQEGGRQSLVASLGDEAHKQKLMRREATGKLALATLTTQYLQKNNVKLGEENSDSRS